VLNEPARGMGEMMSERDEKTMVKKNWRTRLRWIGLLLSFLASLLTAWRYSWEWAVIVLIVMIIANLILYIITVVREMSEIQVPPGDT
jgi:hypothetical protein